ncbi:helix-turn-helix transcriptional regulator [Streptomyces sp.]|uniref:helix-turn-helix domain-containing protein n=1 Tax=Streptomyces sp. TaxID=1931 RepID=UPI002F94371B
MTSKRQQLEEAGRWLRRERERRGLGTAGALARRMGVSDSLISRIETGATAVTDERAEQIAEALSLDIITVRRTFGLWVPDDRSPMDRAEAIMDENERLVAELLARIRRMNRRKQEALLDVLEEDAPEGGQER